MKYLGRKLERYEHGKVFSASEAMEIVLHALLHVTGLIAGTFENRRGVCSLGAARRMGYTFGDSDVTRWIAQENDRHSFRIGPLVLSTESPEKRRERMVRLLQENIRRLKAAEAKPLTTPVALPEVHTATERDHHA